MHEVGIMESTLFTVRREALARAAARVERIVIRIGVLSGVEPDALRFAFEACSPGTIAEDATLDIEIVPAVAHCPECDSDFAAGLGRICRCPQCGGFTGDIRAGRELELRRIEFSTHEYAN
ncbi:MAG TPA: hydrogenase maturation nickel metallochaperone HypA [Candidatus Didemnitutus sp.]|nr:hydrogenase maturation nickel metallochaperone HypA [Candidatus Didemnitutus sp.]